MELIVHHQQTNLRLFQVVSMDITVAGIIERTLRTKQVDCASTESLRLLSAECTLIDYKLVSSVQMARTWLMLEVWLTSVSFNQCVVQSRELSERLRHLSELHEYSTNLSLQRLQLRLVTLIAVECCRLFNQGISNQCVVGYSTKGYSINALQVIQPRNFQWMCCQLFNQGILNQCVVSYSTKGFSINALSVIQQRDFQSLCCQLFNQGIFNQCVVSYSTMGFLIILWSVIQPRDFHSMCYSIKGVISTVVCCQRRRTFSLLQTVVEDTQTFEGLNS